MNRLTWFLGVAFICVLGTQASPVAAAEKQPVVVVAGPMIIAFFPVTRGELQKDADTNEALADFQLYAKQVREPLKKAGIEFSHRRAPFRSRGWFARFQPGLALNRSGQELGPTQPSLRSLTAIKIRFFELPHLLGERDAQSLRR